MVQERKAEKAPRKERVVLRTRNLMDENKGLKRLYDNTCQLKFINNKNMSSVINNLGLFIHILN